MNLPVELLAEVLSLLAVEDDSASHLLAVSTKWHSIVSQSHKLRDYVDQSIKEFCGPALPLKHSDLGNDVPRSYHTFMQDWIRVQFDHPAIWGYKQEQTQLSTVAAYNKIVHVSNSRSKAFSAARELTRQQRRLRASGDHLDQVNCFNLLVLAPHGGLWLALRADGFLPQDWGVFRDAGIYFGLSACCVGFFTAGYCASKAISIIRRRHLLLYHLGSKLPSTKIMLLDSESEWVGLGGCCYWISLLTASSLALLILMSDGLGQPQFSGPERILIAIACVSCMPLLGGVLQWAAARWATSRGHSGFGVGEAKVIFGCHALASWLLLGLSAVHCTEGIVQMVVMLLVIFLPTVGAAIFVAPIIRSRMKNGCALLLERDSLNKGAGYLCIALLVSGAFAIICGRCMRLRWANSVPIVVLVAPLQLPTCCYVGTAGAAAVEATVACLTRLGILLIFKRCSALCRCPKRCLSRLWTCPSACCASLQRCLPTSCS